ncbi:MAG: HlyC/CorC family transporter, partial [Clostridia bacterium]|nr:HlyC/CorC family transporter [Clostridia bacterium]
MSDDPPTTMMWWSIFVMIVLFICNMTVSLSQMALVALNDAQLAKLAEDGDKKAKRCVALLDRAVRFTEAVRLVNVLAGFAFCAAAFAAFFAPLKAWLANTLDQAGAWPEAVPSALAAVLTVLAAVIVWVLFTEGLPRRLAAAKAQSIAFSTVGFLAATLAFVAPLQWLLSKAADVTARLFGIDPNAMNEDVTEEEILLLVDVGEEKGVIEESQKEMINNIFEFDDLTAADIMTPRTDVEAVELGDTVDEALHVSVSHGVSRLPVYEEDIDHVVGVLYIKDLLPYVGKPLPEQVTVRSMMRDPLFVPETKKCGELFSEMTARHMQMAMIVDEYGGIAGIVTMEDLLESIVGNMQDEYDNEQEEVTQIDENRYEVDGTTDIDE